MQLLPTANPVFSWFPTWMQTQLLLLMPTIVPWGTTMADTDSLEMSASYSCFYGWRLEHVKSFHPSTSEIRTKYYKECFHLDTAPSSPSPLHEQVLQWYYLLSWWSYPPKHLLHFPQVGWIFQTAKNVLHENFIQATTFIFCRVEKETTDDWEIWYWTTYCGVCVYTDLPYLHGMCFCHLTGIIPNPTIKLSGSESTRWLYIAILGWALLGYMGGLVTRCWPADTAPRSGSRGGS